MKIGDRVYVQDWCDDTIIDICEGTITDIDGEEALIEFDLIRGGGSIWFSTNNLQLVEDVK